MFVRAIAFLLASAFALCASHPLGSPLPASYRKGVAELLLQPDPQKRASSTARLRADGNRNDIAADYSAALARAESQALGNLRRTLQFIRPTDPIIVALQKDLADYNTAVAAARTLVQTNHHKDKQKHAEMDRAFAELEKAHKKLARTLKPGGTSTLAQFIDALQWTAETRRDQDFCAGKSADLATLPMIAVLNVEGAPESVKALVAELEPFIARRELHRVVSAAHLQMKWARPEQVQFAEILNERRVILGLRPFLLSTELSAACTQHSEEMVKLKYFSHESPIPENKSFTDRVRNAKFPGNGGGECIYAGGSGAAGAHKAWWYSDGHRLILYSTGHNAQGIARHGDTWTFLTGSLTTFPL